MDSNQQPVAASSGCISSQRQTFYARHLVALCWVLGLFLTGLGAKLWLIDRFGTSLPFIDQWDAEAVTLYGPLAEGRLSLGDFFKPHSEHRIVATRIYDLALLLVNGQWDNEVQMVVNAIIHSAAIAGFGLLMARLLGRKSWPFVWLPLALSLGLPFAWENTLAGFQSTLYFMVISSLLTIWLLGLGQPMSKRWWFGVVAGAVSLFTVASGFLAAGAVFGIVVARMLGGRGTWRTHLPTLVVCSILVVSGLLLKVDAPMHRVLQAHSPTEFLISLGKNLAWPWIVLPPFAACNLFPLALLGWFYLRSRKVHLPAEEILLGIGFWVFLQSLATAYARGAGGNHPAWRYMDTTCFLMIVNVFSIVLLLQRYRKRMPYRLLWYAAFSFWMLACAVGLWLLTDRAWHIDIPEQVFFNRSRLKYTRAFLATDDIKYFLNKPPAEIPHPDIKRLVPLLRNAHIQRILPACVRAPLPLVPSTNSTAAFAPDGYPMAKSGLSLDQTWGSYVKSGVGAKGEFESLPVPPGRLPFLKLAVAGDLGEENLGLELVELATGKRTVVTPTQVPGAAWKDCYVRAPAGAFTIVARDNSETKWFAFKAPVEVGLLSRWSVALAGAGVYLLFAGIALFLFNLALWLGGRHTSRAEAGDT